MRSLFFSTLICTMNSFFMTLNPHSILSDMSKIFSICTELQKLASGKLVITISTVLKRPWTSSYLLGTLITSQTFYITFRTKLRNVSIGISKRDVETRTVVFNFHPVKIEFLRLRFNSQINQRVQRTKIKQEPTAASWRIAFWETLKSSDMRTISSKGMRPGPRLLTKKVAKIHKLQISRYHQQIFFATHFCSFVTKIWRHWIRSRNRVSQTIARK